MNCPHLDIVDGRCTECGVEIHPHSWQPSSLIARDAVPPEPPNIGGMLYPAKRTLLSGETESLKTWLALILAKAELDAGYPVAWADVDAMGSGEILVRLRALGVADDIIDRDFLYYEPAERLVGERLTEVCEEVASRGIRLFVIDAFNGMLSLHGLDPSSTPDVETFWREVATPITNAGAAPTLLDHVTKNAEGRGKYAYGSERKASGAIVHLGFRVIGEPLKRGGTGKALLTTHKDRPGFLPRPVVGRLVLQSDGVNVTYTLEEDRSHVGDRFRPTIYMERVSVQLEGEVEARSKNWIEENVTGKADPIRSALDVLVDEGFVSRDETQRGHYFLSVRPFREADDHPADEGDETSSLPRPYLVPSLRSTPSLDLVPRPPPIGDEGRGEVDTSSLASSLRPTTKVHLVVDDESEEIERLAARARQLGHPSGGNSRPLIGDDGYAQHLLDALDRNLMTEGEAAQALGAHEFVREGRGHARR